MKARLRAGLHRLQGLTASIRHRVHERRADTTPKQRRRRRRILIAVVVALLAYPVLGTLALWTGFVEWALKSEDLAIEIDNPAYTIWPGRVHMKRVKVLVNGDTQFTLEGHDLVANVRIFPLVKRKFHVTELAARGVRYRMRVQVESDAGIKERLAAYPPLEELPGAKVIREDQAAKTEKREGSWTVQVDGLDVNVAELWFMEYRFVGDGTLRGGFLVGPNRMRVATSVQDLGPGQLRFGAEQVIANNFGGRITATIPELNPNEHADEGFLDFVTARVTLKGDVETLRHLSAYIDGVDVDAGKGLFKADLLLEKGHLGKQSQIRYETESIELLGDGFGVETDFTLDGGVAVLQVDAKGKPEPAKPSEADLPRIHASAKSTYVSLAKSSERAFTIQIHGHEHEAVLQTNQIGSKMSLKRARLNLPTIVTKDFDDLGAVLSDDPALSAKRGEARASLKLDIDENHVARGPFDARVDDALFQVAGINLGGSARARAALRVDLKRENAVLEDVNVSLADVSMHVGDENVDNWWMNLASKRIYVAKGPPQRYETTIAIRAKDAEPILEGLAEKDKLNDLIAKFTSLDDLRATITLRGSGDANDVTVRSLESDVWDIAGRVWSKGKQSRAALVIGGKAVSIGIASDGKNTEIKPFARDEWLNERLRSFPPPIEQVAPSKP